METNGGEWRERFIVERAHFSHLLSSLQARGYQVVGPTVRDRAIVYDTLNSVEDLPIGYTDEQDGGSYRLGKREDAAVFGYAVGPHSWKQFLHPPALRLWSARRDGNRVQLVPEEDHPPKFAFLGVHSCELQTIAIQDRVFLHTAFRDPVYQAWRVEACIIAVNCRQAGRTCFCVSMQTGPRARSGFDLALTEVVEATRHFFLVESGSPLGTELLQELSYHPASEKEIAQAEQVVADTAAHMGRTMDTTEIKDLLYRHARHPRGDDVASRCLTCGNCTMVCPTCFCTTVHDTTDVTGEHAERWRTWDSCFTLDFSSLVGGSVRTSSRSRYRQWTTHKLASWIGQSGTSGCVGCGRCITWCPVGIDITEEVSAIRARETATQESGGER